MGTSQRYRMLLTSRRFTTNQTSQAQMVAVTALFMIPTALVFPALLRKANTPPSSMTLSRTRRVQRQIGQKQHVSKRGGRNMRQQNRLVNEKDEECENDSVGDGVQKSKRMLNNRLDS